MLRTCYSSPLRCINSALTENQQPTLEAYLGAVIGTNDGAIQAGSDHIQYSFDPVWNFGANEFPYGSTGTPAFQSPLSVLGGPSCVRTSPRSARSV